MNQTITQKIYYCILVLCFLTTVQQTYAHATLTQAQPAPGAQLAQSPTEIRLVFNEPVTADSTITLFTPDFQTVPGLTTQLDPAGVGEVFTALPPLEPNVYTVQWTAVSADRHQISGSYTFTVTAKTVNISWLCGVGFIGSILIVWWLAKRKTRDFLSGL